MLPTPNLLGEGLFYTGPEAVGRFRITFFHSRDIDVVSLCYIHLVSNHPLVLKEGIHWQAGVVVNQKEAWVVYVYNEGIRVVKTNPNGLLC